MKHLAVLLPLLIGAPATAQTPPTSEPQASSPGDQRLRLIPYNPAQVVRLAAATNYQLTLIFGSDERVENVAIGDSEAWQATLNNRGDALFLKPLRSNGVTNMTVITDLRVYSFELSATYGPTAETPYTVRFTHPDKARNENAPTAQATTGRYRLRGARALRPSAISDDGVRTYVEWRAQQTLPAVFAIDERGDEVLLDGHMRDGRYVVDAVHPTLLFRLERQTARADRIRQRPAR
ncbi:TrbG/VirB9 family P-type conjugative transfer protein [Brevundimonas sp.]|uniref:TrbG/VirB9 family P-type conjugative transfer protein n=1 Tax=Brevundimonas sp. TaxID=1871086 RepID=UPI003D6D67B3